MSHEHTDAPINFPSDRDSTPVLDVTEFLEHDPDLASGEAREFRRRSLRGKSRLSLLLFLATCVSVFLVGFTPGAGLSGAFIQLTTLLQTGRLRPDFPAMLLEGVLFAGCLMSILLAHEMGHYVQAVRHRVPATWPFFIPFPFSPFGTMGAVILQDAGRADRRKLFDIAVSGPLAGLVLALPITWYGVATSSVGEVAQAADSVRYGDPLLLRWIVALIHGPYGPNQDVAINAPLFAGWVGLFITGLNLLPVGQLDGGHILYTLIGKKSHYVAYGVIGLAVAWMVFARRYEFALIVGLLYLMGPAHPPTANDRVPLGIGRTILGWLTLAFILIGFTPTPLI